MTASGGANYGLRGLSSPRIWPEPPHSKIHYTTFVGTIKGNLYGSIAILLKVLIKLTQFSHFGGNGSQYKIWFLIPQWAYSCAKKNT